jgi:curved DNA-binding protein CbpA
MASPLRPERRNLYRQLHVQPEAPVEVLKASYRVLMSRLRVHPDLGGSHDQAAQLNAAYAVLSDPQRRALYDQLLRRQARLRPAPGPGATGQAPSRPAPPDPLRWREQQHCPLCAAALMAQPPRNPRCIRCDSPLTPAPSAELADAELLGRRRGERYARPQDAQLRLADKLETFPARVKDLSMTGLSLLVRAPLRLGQTFRVQAHGFDAVALAVAVRPQGQRIAVHARLLSLQVLRHSRGTLVDAEA